MATEWYYAVDGVQYGPASAQELKLLADSKKLLPLAFALQKRPSIYSPDDSLTSKQTMPRILADHLP